jgi:hypothetical protein
MLDVHDTAATKPPPASGTRSTDQVLPSQRSTSGRNSVFERPTAMQARAEAHDTPTSSLPRPLGVLSGDHLVPFHRSTSVLCRGCDALGLYSPTAKHARGEVHDRLMSCVSDAPATLRVAASDQLLPSQRSANDLPPPELRSYPPTAMQKPADEQDNDKPVMLVPGREMLAGGTGSGML